MSRNIGLSVIVCLILILNISAQTIALEESNIETYKLNPYCTSWPTFDNYTADLISSNPSLQAHFAFDLSSIPDNVKIVSATFSAYFYNETAEPSQRDLWYNSNDSWIAVINTADPGDLITADKIVGTQNHNESPNDGYVWKTITITYDEWAKDIADGYISFMLTGGNSGAISLNTGTAIDKEPQLVLEVISEPNKVYTNIFNLGMEELIKTDGSNIDIGTYSVPSTADWNNDGLMDLIVGTGTGQVKVYLNIGTKTEPNFTEFNDKAFYAKKLNSSEINCTPSGCMGCFPKVVDWDSDGLKDLIIGQSSDGSIKFFRNINTDNDPLFDEGTYLKYFDSGNTIKVGARPTPDIVDWNNDGRKDLVVGAIDGKIHIFINEGTDAEPVFLSEIFAQEDGDDLIVKNDSEPGKPRSSPVIFDFNFDGKKDILTGNKDGELLLYKNVGTDEAPLFSGYELVDSNGITIDLAGTPRSRPFVCYWDEDGYPDVLIGAYDGMIHLYRCKTLQADFDKDGDIDFADWAIFTNYWNMTEYKDKKQADLNNDGQVNIDDISWILANWLLNIK